MTYDIWGNVLSIKAGNYTLATYEYASGNGKLKKLTYGNGDYEEYIYDSLERLVQTKLNGVTEYTVKYDANGRLYSLTENDSTHIYEYDSLDRLVRAWQEDSNGNITVAVENSYDDLGRAKGSTYVLDDRTMSYTINYKANSNLILSLRMPDASSGGIMSSLNYTYDEFERWIRKNTSLSTMREVYEEYEYYTYTDANGIEHATTLVSSVTLGVMVNGQTTSVVYSYTYDNLGNITQIRKDGVIINEYTYDSLGQLTCEEDAVAGKTYIYYYDKSGNITQKDSYPFAEGATMGDYISYIASQKETVSTYIYNNSTWGDLLGVYNGKIILYDAIGNPINWRNAKSLFWEGRRLISQTLNSDDTLTYAYNSDGIRTQKKKFDFITGEYRTYNYVLDGSTIIKETVTDPAYSLNYTLYYLYDETGSVQGFIYNNAYYYFQKNLQGDVVRILNSSGAVVTEYTYDAWGKVLTTTGTLASTIGQYNPFRYRSYYYDSETGFYYLQSRYYDPVVGRFLNADHPEFIGANGGVQGYNLFAYCNNNWLSYTDESGECTDGDGYFHFQFAGHDLKTGEACRVCKKTVDDVFFRYPYIWDTVAEQNPYLTGEEISDLVLCQRASVDAWAAARQGRTRQERGEIYEREMSTALCFVAGTIVKTENGDKVIENIEVGDYVWAQDTESGETALKRVVQVFRNKTTELVTVKAGDEVIETTPEHPFYVPNCDEPRANSTGLGKGWIKAKDLRQGDVLVLLDGSTVIVDSVSFVTLDEPITVYNFEVEDFHTYFVGKNGLLVHNSCLPQNGISMSAADALDLASEYLGPGYYEASTDRFVSADGIRQVRIGNKDISGAHGGGPHINFDILSPNYNTSHVYIY